METVKSKETRGNAITKGRTYRVLAVYDTHIFIIDNNGKYTGFPKSFFYLKK